MVVFSGFHTGPSNVRFGSKADIGLTGTNDRFGRKADIAHRIDFTPLRHISYGVWRSGLPGVPALHIRRTSHATFPVQAEALDVLEVSLQHFH